MDDPECTLYCGNLAPDVTEEILYELFLQAGPLQRVKIPKDKDGRLRTYGFVTFKHDVSVSYAIDLMSGLSLLGRPLRLHKRSGSSEGGNGDFRFGQQKLPCPGPEHEAVRRMSRDDGRKNKNSRRERRHADKNCNVSFRTSDYDAACSFVSEAPYNCHVAEASWPFAKEPPTFVQSTTLRATDSIFDPVIDQKIQQRLLQMQKMQQEEQMQMFARSVHGTASHHMQGTLFQRQSASWWR